MWWDAILRLAQAHQGSSLHFITTSPSGPMGNSGSTDQSSSQEPAPVEDKFEVSIATNLVYRLAADADKEAANAIPVVPLQKEPEKVEPQLDQSIVDQPPHVVEPEVIHSISPINTEKLSELLETQRQERRAESEAKRAQQSKTEEELIREVQTKIDVLRNTYARSTVGTGCAKESKAVLECYKTGTNCNKAIEDLRLCAKARIET